MVLQAPHPRAPIGPCFAAARRYQSADGAYLAIYELDDLDALKAPRVTTKSDVIHIDSVTTYELLP